MIIKNLAASSPQIMTLPDLVEAISPRSSSGEVVTPERSQSIASAYRCINILSDDIGKMPFQTFSKKEPGKIERIKPNAFIRNISYLLEVKPNRYMTPFIFKKTFIRWLLCWGHGYAWRPLGDEIFILPSNVTFPMYDVDGNLWYQTTFKDGTIHYIPDWEMVHSVINSFDGVTGKSVIEYARESLGRQLSAQRTQGQFFNQGLNPAGIIWMNGSVDEDARTKVRRSYETAMSGIDNAYRLAVMDNKITKFEPITMKPADAQFLESIGATDSEIANFFGVPLYKLNSGKQSYQSNEQQNLDYLNTTIDPYLVQIEQAAALKWLQPYEQAYTYFRFNRDVILRTDAKTRAEYLKMKIESGQMSPNEAREIDDMSSYEGGDDHYMASNIASIEKGYPSTTTTTTTTVQGDNGK
jgi:HK97 family phage portal protein